MVIVKRKIRILIPAILLAVFGLQACALFAAPQPEGTPVSQTSGEVPTWTPRPQDLTLTALPTATELAPVSEALGATPTEAAIGTPRPTRTPKEVMFTATSGNLNVRSGPSINYNYVGVLYAGETVEAVGRDRISRWVLIKLPNRPGVTGWVTTETDYSTVQGDVSILPFVQVEPASPAYIRNCTKHTMLISPTGVELLSKFDEPYNEERFGVGVYQVYDLENPDADPVQEISLSEGRTIDIRVDWKGEKSKCLE
jgi:hypothetical protein